MSFVSELKIKGKKRMKERVTKKRLLSSLNELFKC